MNWELLCMQLYQILLLLWVGSLVQDYCMICNSDCTRPCVLDKFKSLIFFAFPRLFSTVLCMPVYSILRIHSAFPLG